MKLGTLNRLNSFNSFGGQSRSSYWTPLTLVVEDAAPNNVVMTGIVANTSAVASDFTVAGFTVSSLSRDATNKILTLTLSLAVVYGDSVAIVYKGKSYTVTNNVLVPPPPYITFNTLVGITKSGNRYISGSGAWTQYGVSSEALTGDFSVGFVFQRKNGEDFSTNSVMLGLRDDLSNTGFNGANGGYDYFIFGNASTTSNRGYSGANVAATGVTFVYGDVIRLRRTSGIVYAEYRRNGAWNLLYTYPNSLSGTLYATISFGGPGPAMYYPVKNIESWLPYKLVNSVFVFDGNSLTMGWYLQTSYSDQLLTGSPFNVDMYNHYANIGVPSQTTMDMISRAAANIDAYHVAGVVNIVVANEIGNDIIVNGASVRDAVTHFWNYCDARRAAGFKVFAVNLQSRMSLNETYRQQVNALMASEYASHADYLVDLASTPELSVYHNLTYVNADGIHNNTVGYGIWKREILKAIMTYINGI
jgi:lysophospholipase L1-like esterase